jgi:hypothetical protein
METNKRKIVKNETNCANDINNLRMLSYATIAAEKLGF